VEKENEEKQRRLIAFIDIASLENICEQVKNLLSMLNCLKLELYSDILKF